ncbi:lipocalin family protein [Algibacter sp. R77976]|uniref:lipocalin family protein n=1 Tax=Algibacter sp. R77976 TaxID=3093873 RepID=UPI0037CC4248
MKTLLKNYKLIIILLLMAPLFSCSSDDDNNDTPEPTVAELLANKWFYEQLEDTSTNPATITELNDCEKQSYFNFLSDGTLIVEFFGLDDDDICQPDGIEGYTYILSADGKQLIIQTDTDPIFFTIDFIDSSTLTFYNQDSPTVKSTLKR